MGLWVAKGILATWVVWSSIVVGVNSGASSRASKNPPFALEAARELVAPKPTLREKAEFEGGGFWEEHDDLLTRAWQELGPRHGDLYKYGHTFEKRYLSKALRRAARDAREGGNETSARDLFKEVVPGVFASEELFTQEFLNDLLEELEHVQGSGIPMRRPNGMNRYGVILDHVGLESSIQGLVEASVRPLASMLFPELVGVEDADEHFAFTVQYDTAGDTELAKHGDASVVTLNLCLGRPGWTGGYLRFFERGGSGFHVGSSVFKALPRGNASAGSGDLSFRPGLAVLHRGQHKHQALPLVDGVRTNAIVWLMGKHGVVRVAPYAEHEQLSVYERWHRTSANALEL
ncbi:unnamed protein product [Polarella glacialis]|uniref:Fe2OG dioxygenase domain-containing protein n=1 Tax=Polarella glacialis TaxID=89957 RepID=A0A813EB59_POLGL|nr:unnamed protein product [Polarella glacialis]